MHTDIAHSGPNPAYVWISLVWILTAAITFALVGRLSDVMGRRWFFITGNFFGLLGTIINGTAQRIPVVIGGSTLIGISGAVQLSFPVVLGELVPNKHRPYANLAMYVFSLPFASFGPVISRSFVLYTKLGWTWSYYLNTILNGLVTILFFLFVPSTDPGNASCQKPEEVSPSTIRYWRGHFIYHWSICTAIRDILGWGTVLLGQWSSHRDDCRRRNVIDRLHFLWFVCNPWPNS